LPKAKQYHLKANQFPRREKVVSVMISKLPRDKFKEMIAKKKEAAAKKK
jgi:hypothetical protein